MSKKGGDSRQGFMEKVLGTLTETVRCCGKVISTGARPQSLLDVGAQRLDVLARDVAQLAVEGVGFRELSRSVRHAGFSAGPRPARPRGTA